MDVISYDIPSEVLQKIAAEQAFHYRIVPFAEEAGALVLLTDSQSQEDLLAELKIILDMPISLRPCGPEVMTKLLTANYRVANTSQIGQLGYSNDFLEKILYNAKLLGSSDIHFEPYEDSCRIRYRLDGKLLEQYRIPLSDYPTMINKVKIRANLDIAEKRLPQDGRITIKNGADEFDLRVSSLPTLFGEKLVLRILSRDSGTLQLEQLGFSKTELKSFLSGIQRPNGIVLISGPTGSGKTTTLYAALKLLNKAETNILTIEDPIEYTLQGVNQVQLKENIGLDFATALRTFLRQDPDIIMVGEIRDAKTANMAIRAALTGHLVLSTIHTNSAWGTISRLIDMDIPPFLITSTLNMSVAQRLVRKLCDHCKTKVDIHSDDLSGQLDLPADLTHHYQAVGCQHCHQTGYKGRKAIYEILPVTKTLEEAVKNNNLDIDRYIKDHNIASLRTNAIQLVKDGVTSLVEVYPLLMH
ncbi:GspE/PulE family protein [Flagellimonas sp. DF-77]|uniref:GspE/PulE family protein n=1 Tax=Flagellimonas algarum TaxID=3230298 RepID=UPI0033971BB5